MTNQLDEQVDFYADNEIPSKDAKVPWWLWLTYCSLPIWGIVTFLIYWNGSVGWLDRGYWAQLQTAANTTFPFENHDLTVSERAALDASQGQ